MHTPTLTHLAPAIEKVAPRLEQALDHARDHLPDHRPHLRDHLPDHRPHLTDLADHLPDRLASHLPGQKKRKSHKGLMVLGLAVLGGVAGWFAMRRGAAPAWAPASSAPSPTRSAADSKAPASGYEKPDAQATGAPGNEGGYADRGADDGYGGAAIGGIPEVSEGPYGTGSAAPLDDGSAPGAAYTIKGDAFGKVFHTRESPDYDTTDAGVWFCDAATARAAGFMAWDDK